MLNRALFSRGRRRPNPAFVVVVTVALARGKWKDSSAAEEGEHEFFHSSDFGVTSAVLAEAD